MRRIMLRRPVLAGVMVAVAGLAAGITWAAIPDSNGVFTGCYSKNSQPVGRLRVINPNAGQRCMASEVQITWNQKGINWRGALSSSSPYQRDDAVVRLGTRSRAIARHP